MNQVSIELITGTMVFISFKEPSDLNRFCREVAAADFSQKLYKKGRDGIEGMSTTHQNPLLKEVTIISLLLKPDKICFLSV